MRMTGCQNVSVACHVISSSNPGEVYRVHWLRAKARKTRWMEEVILLKSEMEWMHGFFLFKAKKWDVVKDKAVEKGDRGLECYAVRQADVYIKLAGICQLE